MKNILCYGDSNTYGAVPLHGGRHPYEVRWPGALQGILGNDYRVIEEGLDGRSTVFEDEASPGKNGVAMLTPIIASHMPLDLIIIMLGTNDLKQRYNLTPADLSRNIKRVIDEVLKYDCDADAKPQLLIVAPVHIESGVSKTFGRFNEGSAELSRHFADEYAAVCKLKGCHFFDASLVARASDEDHLHMNAQNHRLLAAALAEEIKKIL